MNGRSEDQQSAIAGVPVYEILYTANDDLKP
jgi:hypothetical protein